MILIYSHTLSNRFKYVTELIFKSVLNSNYELTDDLNYFQSKEIPKIAYTTTPINAQVYMCSNPILFETDIKSELPIAKKEFEDTYKKISLDMSQIEFQREVGRLEVLGELLIRNK